MSDSQDQAETFDEDMTGSDPVSIDQAGADSDAEWPPARPHGIQFADADVTDESFAERTLQEEPEEVPDPNWDDQLDADIDDAEVGGLADDA